MMHEKQYKVCTSDTSTSQGFIRDYDCVTMDTQEIAMEYLQLDLLLFFNGLPQHD